MRTALLFLLLVGSAFASTTLSGTASLAGKASLSPPLTVNLLITCESGSDNDLITSTIADAASVQNISGTWTLTPDPLTAFWVGTPSLAALLRPVSINGVLYNGSGGTRCWKVDHSGATNQSVAFRKNATTGSVSFGCWIKSTLPGVTAGGQYDLFDVTGVRAAGGTTTCVIQLVDSTGGVFGFRAHASSPSAGSTFGTTYLSVTDTLYWITGMYDSVNGMCRMKIYSSAGSLLHTSECAVDTGNLNSVLLRLNPSEHGLNPSAVTKFDNVIFDWTNAVFPLGVP